VPDYINQGKSRFFFGNKIVFKSYVNSYTAILNPDAGQTNQSVTPTPTFLIVDDEKDIRYLLNSILKQKNISAGLAGTLEEADKFIEKERPAVIFLDNHLPDGRGLEHITRIKKLNPASKIIMITAHDNPSDREKAYREGADFFISKPFTKDIICKTIEQIKQGSTVE
jgi:two-component system, OmpR family, response regulator